MRDPRKAISISILTSFSYVYLDVSCSVEQDLGRADNSMWHVKSVELVQGGQGMHCHGFYGGFWDHTDGFEEILVNC